MKILVTGGAGFIGSHTVKKLLADGHHITVFDNFSSGKKSNLPSSYNLAIIEADIRDRKSIGKAVVGKDAIMHLAAQVSVQASIADPIDSNSFNVEGFLNVLDSAWRAGVKRFVYASSAAVYGTPIKLPLNEDSLTSPSSPYGLEKLIDDQYAELYRKLYDFSIIGLRYFNVYGPGQDGGSPYSGVISKFVKAFQADSVVTVLGDGKQTRDFVFVGDIAKINAAALYMDVTGVCNIGSGNSVSLLELMDILKKLTGIVPDINFAPHIAGDIRYSSMDSARQKYIFGDIVMTSLESGLNILWNSGISE